MIAYQAYYNNKNPKGDLSVLPTDMFFLLEEKIKDWVKTKNIDIIRKFRPSYNYSNKSYEKWAKEYCQEEDWMTYIEIEVIE